ncbi:peptidylprolyl isomerase [Janthinobacterium sp. 17J80-10]|uniref:FKBP-type peptidyl-prolyl cis-trans isomerase n=1 Tax=Janthinobacterium sp. 17J80-10 TaxID=2497863 RepID=UPI0010053B29|nr:peptidylprolyl isomerase [Janthinobacterium sp. 17J80-10]QAU33743.1 peptidylprolyl isomerase [Janthinobacterium sp. 17J80-10]
MKIDKDTAVTLRLTIAESNGKLLQSGKTPMAYLHGGYDNLFPKLEEALQGQEAGFKATLDLAPEDAFGVRDESLLRTISKKDFPPGVKVGGELEGYNDAGEAQIFTVLKIKGDQVMLDGNHPLADKALRVGVEVISVRAATAEEITHRHVHGEHGHHH